MKSVTKGITNCESLGTYRSSKPGVFG